MAIEYSNSVYRRCNCLLKETAVSHAVRSVSQLRECGESEASGYCKKA